MCGNGGMWHHGYGGWGWGSWILTAMVLTLFFALVITAIVAAVRYLGGPGHHHGPGAHGVPPGRRPEELLAERFARGDIDDEEYRRRVALLREHQ
ncbi:MAG: SHOCT domain-containing protein [Mycobacterium sp.]